MNAKVAKKIRKEQRKNIPNIDAEIQIAIERAFLMGVEVGWTKAVERYEATGAAWPHGELNPSKDIDVTPEAEV